MGSCLLSVVSSSRTITQKEHLNIHNVVAELVNEDLVTNEVLLKNLIMQDLVTNEVLLKNYCLPISDYEEDSINVKSFSNFSSAESLGGAFRAEAKDRWTASSGITVKFHYSLTDQLRGSSMRLEVQVIYKLKYQKELMVKPEMCWNHA